MSERSTSETSASLLRRARIQDPVAWRRLVDTYGRRVYRWCRQSGLQPADANNVAQDVFAVIARKLSTFEYRQDGDTFRGWMRRITQNKIRDHFREAVRVPRASGGTNWFRQVAELQEVPTVETGSETSRNHEGTTQKLEFVRNVKNLVSERDWQLFWRVVVDGQSAVEVGEEFGVTANTVRIVKMRVLRKLRNQIVDSEA